VRWRRSGRLPDDQLVRDDLGFDALAEAFVELAQQAVHDPFADLFGRWW
jgi:hypothetical protein